MPKLPRVSEISQWVSAGVVATGVICEYIFKRDLYLFLITFGTFAWAITQKVKHPSKPKKSEKEDQ